MYENGLQIYLHSTLRTLKCFRLFLLLRPRELLRSIVMSRPVCLSLCGSVCVLRVCLSARISPEPHARSLPFLCVFPMSVARSSGALTIGRIAYRRERGDGSAQRRRSVIDDCLVCFCLQLHLQDLFRNCFTAYLKTILIL